MSYSIGELAKVASTKVETIRYYEKIGLMPQADRTSGNHRSYSRGHRDRLAFIRHARELGFALEDIRALLDFSDRPEASCAEADAIAKRHLSDVRSKISRLQALEQELSRMVEQCSCNVVADCRVIEVLADHRHCNHDH
ncbi:MerR family transcriptional regulator [Terrihabitans soli]|uniref:MerR family transcriptional regulator n=1 Tax=Terrihabitans soli TaxID=708113 RepID=A0A6S6QTK9_9HYPH|nr:helix-turn-helix domain-containing protein [Terrihabitans soli]BCJ90602.1 MerR family transcriptional regulator [Terrihabitans soli]